MNIELGYVENLTWMQEVKMNSSSFRVASSFAWRHLELIILYLSPFASSCGSIVSILSIASQYVACSVYSICNIVGPILIVSLSVAPVCIDFQTMWLCLKYISELLVIDHMFFCSLSESWITSNNNCRPDTLHQNHNSNRLLLSFSNRRRRRWWTLAERTTSESGRLDYVAAANTVPYIIYIVGSTRYSPGKTGVEMHCCHILQCLIYVGYDGSRLLPILVSGANYPLPNSKL